jgi:hypothetical protein
MSLGLPQNGEYYAPAYQVSALPYLSSSIISAGNVHKYEFPFVTKFINVVNRGANVGDKLALAFTENGLRTGNYITLDQGVAVDQEIRTSVLFISGSGGTSVDYQIFCGLTTIPTKNFLTLTGSNGHPGVG